MFREKRKKEEKDGNTKLESTVYLRGFYRVMGNGRKYLLARETIETIRANFQNFLCLERGVEETKRGALFIDLLFARNLIDHPRNGWNSCYDNALFCNPPELVPFTAERN